MSTLLSVPDDAVDGATQTSNVPASRSTPSSASSAVVTQPPFSAPPRPLYLQRPARTAASALGPSRPPRIGSDDPSTEGGTPCYRHETQARVGHKENDVDLFDVFGGDFAGGSSLVHTNLPDDGVPSGSALLYLSSWNMSPRRAAAVGAGSPPGHAIDVDADFDGQSSSNRRPAPPPIQFFVIKSNFGRPPTLTQAPTRPEPGAWRWWGTQKQAPQECALVGR